MQLRTPISRSQKIILIIHTVPTHSPFVLLVPLADYPRARERVVLRRKRDALEDEAVRRRRQRQRSRALKRAVAERVLHLVRPTRAGGGGDTRAVAARKAIHSMAHHLMVRYK